MDRQMIVGRYGAAIAPDAALSLLPLSRILGGDFTKTNRYLPKRFSSLPRWTFLTTMIVRTISVG